MTAKEYLTRYKLLKVQIAAKQERINELRQRAQSVSSPSLSGSKPTVLKGEGKHETLTDECNKLENDLMVEKIRLTYLQREIEHTISKVEDDKQRTFLEKYYLNCHSMTQISDDMGYCYRQIKRIHREALAAVKNVLECPLDDVV